eukprot:CAMPEP_0184369270 /NCGR_PEP_ID=MMETSP1089-20130417/162151_1 /TAXON_ID=38269 ORGANISM="Gloeochaete wittrockiana, Strain SAG46.84" /NCGR_SAMPLE_ID=MMETSP1089 /ASSEMBLY_ACC=CAM_ASM_000445 /LENGTH=70 /DNA_ID=CAMNT_0026711697 /DNA_START=686 /DNA_END=898 /DNA_ORIENTATION=-
MTKEGHVTKQELHYTQMMDGAEDLLKQSPRICQGSRADKQKEYNVGTNRSFNRLFLCLLRSCMPYACSSL